ncbi:MAG: recombinase family protein, partial [Planctomycetota bacterium]
MVEEIENDVTVSHVMIPRRDRLARPEDPLDGVRLENKLRSMGVNLVFMERSLAPKVRGQATDIAETIDALIGYHRSDEEVRILSQKIVLSQLALAKAGYSCGGRPPHGFRRFLVNTDGVVVRELEDGELVKRERHHIIWLPGDEAELEVVRRVFQMLDDLVPACRIASMLTEEEVPTPDAGRKRTDGGQQHETAGVWHTTTVVEIARNPIYVGKITYGRRAMGRLSRQTPDGPRILKDDDFRSDGKPKVIRNAASMQTTATATFAPVVAPEQWERVNRILDERGKSQRGVPRSRHPGQNPLGSHIFDMACGWPMYRRPYRNVFRYDCGLYMQSHGQKCAHNTVGGPEATAFVLSTIRENVLNRSLVKKIGVRLREIAVAETAASPAASVVARKESRLRTIETDLTKAARNMTLANNAQHLEAMTEVYDELQRARMAVELELAEARRGEARPRDIEAEVETALA